ncbi:electron transport complex subunit RsxC [candidate division KSB3 bacterium]|uniref:Ion-translocating oxidoreductase complex subunit C n=1 Tax=candidate division KSB3 bacterium TaxID=2044937 RepID=A0A2G6E5Q3_9BACT|nr:MAG: electron transport complex subunit RsxC [candidate division KSB3 bacterium]PIE29922.1 MAG: electron transport complex subunit RsxC [candidate division KSB3 bacterium]
MELKTFKQGIHPHYYKELTSDKAPINMPLPKEIVIPLQQHIGAPCKPLVSVRDEVRLGQKIGESQSFVSSPVHASVSGTVKKIEARPHPGGAKVNAIVISPSDGDQALPPPGPQKDATDLSPDEIKRAVKNAGMVGLGGAGFPTHIKLSPPKDKHIDTIVINGAECEPYLTSDHHMMLEAPEDIIYGTKLIMRATNAQQAFIGIEANKPRAIETLSRLVSQGDRITVIALDVKYPQGAEKMLIKAAVDREVPAGGLPMDVGVGVNNVTGTVVIARAVRDGLPVIERIVTVTGKGIKNPQNVRVRVGTPIRDIIEFCGGLTPDARKVIMGGPMMGIAQSTLDVPTIKASGGLLILTESEINDMQPHACIRCGKCVHACPMGLIPSKLGAFIERDMFDKIEAYNVNDCMECGCCVYVCPAKRPMVQWIKVGKAVLRARNARKN